MSRERESALHASVSALPPVPIGWFFFCTERELRRGPVLCDFLNRKLVAFSTSSGRVGILDARCQHLGADLAQGRVVDDCLECPLHNWQYATDGQCRKIPQSETIPDFARQKSYPAEVRHGLVFLWNGPRPLYSLPFYENAVPEEFACSTPAVIDLHCPWYLVGANSFDSQHLYSVHERVLLQPPQIKSVGNFALSSRTVTKVGTRTRYDRFIRSFSGPVATMVATNWSGSLVFVRVEMQRTTTFGMVSLRPLGEERVLVHIVAFLPRSHSALPARRVDSMRTALRLYFIRQFLKDDVRRLEGVRAGTLNLIDADAELALYFQWLARTANGIPAITGQNENANYYEGAHA
jgi:phenylpropionate dioxygenase-like ring-hydroxylating dioxygenase large terminal subunit